MHRDEPESHSVISDALRGILIHSQDRGAWTDGRITSESPIFDDSADAAVFNVRERLVSLNVSTEWGPSVYFIHT